MMTHLWVYDGALDAAGRVLTLHAEGPDMFAGGKVTQYRNVIDFKSNENCVLTSHLLGKDDTSQ